MEINRLTLFGTSNHTNYVGYIYILHTGTQNLIIYRM